MANITEVSKEIRRAVDSGKTTFGFRQAEKTLLSGSVELIVFSNNTPKSIKQRIQEYAAIAKTPCFNFEGNGLELGAVCGKPFVVSVLSIINPGKSKILDVIKEEKKQKSQSEKKIAKKSLKKQKSNKKVKE